MSEGSDDDGGEPTLYELLYCAPSATEAELKQAYRQQALHWHPDKNGDPEAEERFKAINTAWNVLSDEHQRAAYDSSLARGAHDEIHRFHTGGQPQSPQAASEQRSASEAAAHARRMWEVFQKAEELDRLAQRRREHGLLVGVCSLAVWLVLLLWLLPRLYEALADQPLPAWLMPQPLEALTTKEMSKLPLGLSWQGFQEKLVQRHQAKLPPPPALLAWLLPKMLLPTTHTPYCRFVLEPALSLPLTSLVRRAPEAGQRPRGWLLVHTKRGEDVHGRPVELTSNTYVRLPDGRPKPWPNAKVLCARLLASDSIKHKDWWADLSRATGGRLRTFELAAVPSSECEPEYSGVALALFSGAALALASFTVRLLLGPAVPNYVEVGF